MTKKRAAVLLALMLAAAFTYAGAEEVALPPEILSDIEQHYGGYMLEDYATMPDSPEGEIAIALLKSSAARELAVYREKKDGMKLWFSTKHAVPQHENPGWISVMEEGQIWTDAITGKDHVSDGLRFTVGIIDDNRETTEQSVTYQYEDGSFKLVEFSDQITWNCFIRDGYLEYWNLSSGDEARIYGELQQEIRYVNYDTLPKTIAEAEATVTIAPTVPRGKILGSGYLTAKRVKFSGGRNHAVYTGPGKQYARSGNGKGTVSTNDWIQVFGQYDDYIMIQYDISADRFRIGWIEASALPNGVNIPELELWLDHADYGDVIERCVLTDDPFNSGAEIAVLEVGTPVCELVHSMDGWSYIRVTINGVPMCGFVPMDCISHG